MDDKARRYSGRDERVLAGRVSLITAVFTAMPVLAERAITGSIGQRSGEIALLCAAVVLLGVTAFAGLPRLPVKRVERAYLASVARSLLPWVGLRWQCSAREPVRLPAR